MSHILNCHNVMFVLYEDFIKLSYRRSKNTISRLLLFKMKKGATRLDFFLFKIKASKNQHL